MAGKGKPKTGGRRKGTPNKTTVAVKEAFTLAFERIGGVEKLTEWADENPGDFFKLYARLLPSELSGPEGKPLIPITEPPNMLEMARSVAFVLTQADKALTEQINETTGITRTR